MIAVDPYSTNPFRVLGLRSDASGKDTGRGVDRLLKWIELGETPQVEDLFPYLGLLRRDRDQIKKASSEVEDPRIRINSELYWPSYEYSGFDACQEFLKSGQYSQLTAHCEKAVADGLAGRKNAKSVEPQLDASLGCHYLAVFYHSAAISSPRGLAPSGQKPPVDWDNAFRYWMLVSKDEVYWRHVVERARLLNDPRVSASYVEQLRRGLPATLLRVNVSRAIASVEGGRSDGLVLNCRIIKKAQFGSEGDQALREVALLVQAPFEKALREIQSAVSENTIRTQVPKVAQSVDGAETGFNSGKLTAYLAAIEESIKKKLVPIGRSIGDAGLDQTEPGYEVLDGVAYAYRSVSLAFNNYGGMPHASLRLTAAAREFARGTQCIERLDEDYQALQLLSLQKDAAELAAASRYKESLAKLEEARQFVTSDDERRTIDEWVEVAKKRIALEGVKQIASPPTMFTFNGIGTRLYGKRGYDPHSQSYVSTLFFTFVFLPIFPLASYRVRNVGGGQYRFLGKVPMKLTAFIAPAIVAVVIGFFMLQDNTDTSTSRLPQSPPSSSVGTVTSSQSSNADKDSLGKWIDQERARLKEEEAELDSEASQIDTEHQLLDQKVNELNSGSPSQEEIDRYEADRRRFNGRVQAHNARLGRHEADVTSFNAQIERYNSMR